MQIHIDWEYGYYAELQEQILKELGYCCFAAHCHFALRGKESDRDRDFAKYISTKLSPHKTTGASKSEFSISLRV